MGTSNHGVHELMITIDCPICAGQADVDARLTAIDCDACGVVEIGPDPAEALDLVA